MKIVAGLGNPGIEYAETRHNIGFVFLDMLAEAWELSFRPKYQGLVAEGNWRGERVYLFKPQTYMNLSGRALRELTTFFKVPSEQLLVVHDDLDLPLGKIRLRQKGSAGGHNGIRSIAAELGTEIFWRLKLGIGRPPEGWETAKYVLGRFTDEEVPQLDDVLTKAEKLTELWLSGESEKGMNLYHR